VDYKDDGIMTLWWDNCVMTTGSYSVENNEFHTGEDTTCDEQNSGSVTYASTYEDGRLSFEVIGENLCDGRRDSTSWSYFGPQ